MTTIAENIDLIRRRINEYERRYNRSPGSVLMLAVSKKQSAEKIREAHATGLRHFGENYLQEAADKQSSLQDLECQWHFIGAIQSNKTRALAEQFAWIHSVDSEKVARRLSAQRPASMPPLNLCVQVNLSGEHSKSGVTLADCGPLCVEIAPLPGIRLRGLMAIPAPLPGFEEQRGCFRTLAEQFHRLGGRLPGLDTLSMGMSNDFEAAIAEGSTLIRVGTAVFGVRE